MIDLEELIRITRVDIDDEVEPFGWSNEDMTEYANDAESEACRRARLIVDSSSAATTISVLDAPTVDVPDISLYALHASVIFIRKARFVGYAPLIRISRAEMDELNPFWEDADPGMPTHYIPDYQTGYIKLWPTPSGTGDLLMTVVRTPLAEMVKMNDVPEINQRFVRSLRYWMAFRAYSKQDVEANDPKKAADSLALFEQEFGKKSTAIDEVWINANQQDGDGTF